jgi:hypothetical protein
MQTDECKQLGECKCTTAKFSEKSQNIKPSKAGFQATVEVLEGATLP